MMMSAQPTWNQDGGNGLSDPNHSENVLLNWLLVPGNYDNYRGGDRAERTMLSRGIANLIIREGCSVHRGPIAVRNKIYCFEQAFKRALEWKRSATGAGLEDTDNETYNRILTMKCEHFYALETIMGQRSGVSYYW
jgi:hypothetical protein